MHSTVMQIPLEYHYQVSLGECSCQKVAGLFILQEGVFRPYFRLMNCDRAISVGDNGDNGDVSEFEPPNPLEMIDLSRKAPCV